MCASDLVVSGIEAGVDSVSFTVDRTGVPVVVKVSYFPNWKVEGADGPWRITPNLMVVVPTEESVSLSYGRTGTDVLAMFLTLVGLAALVVLWRRREPTWPMDAWYEIRRASCRERVYISVVAVSFKKKTYSPLHHHPSPPPPSSQ